MQSRTLSRSRSGRVANFGLLAAEGRCLRTNRKMLSVLLCTGFFFQYCQNVAGAANRYGVTAATDKHFSQIRWRRIGRWPDCHTRRPNHRNDGVQRKRSFTDRREAVFFEKIHPIPFLARFQCHTMTAVINALVQLWNIGLVHEYSMPTARYWLKFKFGRI
jgi:hypothetical protein